MRIIWSPVAMERIAEIGDYIARDRPQAASDWVQGTIAAVERLVRFPESGRRVPELQRMAIHEVIHGKSRLLYRIDPDQIVVVTIRHAGQSLTEMMLTSSRTRR